VPLVELCEKGKTKQNALYAVFPANAPVPPFVVASLLGADLGVVLAPGMNHFEIVQVRHIEAEPLHLVRVGGVLVEEDRGVLPKPTDSVIEASRGDAATTTGRTANFE